MKLATILLAAALILSGCSQAHADPTDAPWPPHAGPTDTWPPQPNPSFPYQIPTTAGGTNCYPGQQGPCNNPN
jgi:PBP1b-binding outer membrane lipoprotein LpoB